MDIRKYFKTKILIQFLLSLSFIVNLFISEISNYNPSSFYLKLASTILLILFVYIDFRANRNGFTFNYATNNSKRVFIILFSFLLFLLTTLIYSHNIEFGIEKVGYLLISTFPAIIIFYYLLFSANKERITLFLHTLLFIGLLFGILSLILSPYNPATIYSFELQRWSHVISGRFLGSITVIALILHFSNIIKTKYLISITVVLLTSTYFVGLRAAFLGIIVVIIGLVAYSIISKNRKTLTLLSLSLFFSITLILIISQFNNLSTARYSKLQTNDVGKFEDGAINARLIAYNVSWQNIKEHPILGVGLGGFNNKKISGDITEIKYPHNLLIEIQLELGLIGTLFFVLLLSIIFYKAYKFSIPLFTFLLFSFWLAMFSKDIATQTQLWIGIAVLGIEEKKKTTNQRLKSLVNRL